MRVLLNLVVIMTHYPPLLSQEKPSLVMASTSSKRSGVKELHKVYTKQWKVESFNKGLNLSNLGDEEVIILESCSEDERDHIGPLMI